MLARHQLAICRYVGVVGSAALAIGAYQVGARAGDAHADGLPGLAEAPGILACLAGLLLLTAAWWRVGALSAPMTGRWMLVTAALWAAPLLAAPPLASRDVYAYACHGALLSAGLDPHAVGPAALPCPWLDSVPPVWRETPSPYGPAFGLIEAASAALSAGEVGRAVAVLRVAAVAGLLLAIWYGLRLALLCGVNPARAAWLGLAAPLVLVHAVSGAHNDALMCGLVVAALGVAANRARTATARSDAAVWVGALMGVGALLGVAAAVKVTALVALPFAAILLASSGASTAARLSPGVPAARRTVARIGWTMAGLTASAAAAFTLLAAGSGLGMGFLRGLGRTGELGQWTSVPTAVGMSLGYALRVLGLPHGYDTAVAVARAAGLVIAVAVAGLAWWRAWRNPQPRVVVAAAGVAFAAVALLGPVFYPWYALVPNVLLAVSVRDEHVRAWLGVAVGVLAFLVLPNGVGLAPRTKAPGALAVTAGLLVVAVRYARSVRSARRRAVPTTPTATGS